MIIDNFDLQIALENNIMDEAEARTGYYKILRDFEHLLTPAEINLLEEIIAEELKHTEILREMVYRRNRIKPEN